MGVFFPHLRKSPYLYVLSQVLNLILKTTILCFLTKI
jgi:hypothetical protein